MEQLHLNKNNLNNIFYPECGPKIDDSEPAEKCFSPFGTLNCLLLGNKVVARHTQISIISSVL